MRRIREVKNINDWETSRKKGMEPSHMAEGRNVRGSRDNYQTGYRSIRRLKKRQSNLLGYRRRKRHKPTQKNEEEEGFLLKVSSLSIYFSLIVTMIISDSSQKLNRLVICFPAYFGTDTQLYDISAIINPFINIAI